ncbi:MAG TPA: sugar nucleotide-binding protein, partial [Aggregatilineales bacterium]|nr:sugar nucleotide-binding protein [Aggregatilineales bacterium]
MRIYLTGGTGFLGSNIIRVAREQDRHELLSTLHSSKTPAPADIAYEAVNLADRDAVSRSVAAFRPDVIIHSAILNDFAQMYADRKLAWQLYVTATHSLTDAANATGAKMILISTDWVFDGTQVDADETTPPNPVNYYGV